MCNTYKLKWLVNNTCTLILPSARLTTTGCTSTTGEGETSTAVLWTEINMKIMYFTP